MRTAILFIALIPCVISDVRRREIPVLLIGVLGIAGFLAQLFLFKSSWIDLLLGGGLGVMFMAVSLLSHGSVGMGDAIMITAAGLWCGIAEAASLVLIAVLLAAITGGLLILFKKIGRKQSLPFAPFLEAACLIRFILQFLQGS